MIRSFLIKQKLQDAGPNLTFESSLGGRNARLTSQLLLHLHTVPLFPIKHLRGPANEIDLLIVNLPFAGFARPLMMHAISLF